MKTNLITLCFGLLLLSGTRLSLAQQPQPGDTLLTFAVPPGEVLSTTYAVKVNGQSVPVIRYEAQRAAGYGSATLARSVGIAQFAFAGRVTVEITVTPSLPANFLLSPLSYGLNPQVNGNTVRFVLDRPRKLLLHYGGEWGLGPDNESPVTERLALFANAPEAEPDLSQPAVLDVARLGVDGSGQRFVADALQQAIDSVAQRPQGGTVYVPPGTYNLDKGLYLRSNVTLYLAGGSLLRGITVKLGKNNCPDGILAFKQVRNAAVAGLGTVSANGSAYRKDGQTPPDFTHAPLVWTKQATDCQISGVTLRDAANIHCYIEHESSNIRLRNLKLVTDADYFNTDGFNPNQASNVTFEDGFVFNTDDMVAAGYSDGFENVQVKNSVMRTYQGNLKLLHHPFQPGKTARRVSFENIDLLYSTGIGVVNGEGRGPYLIEDIFYKNIRSENLREGLFDFRVHDDTPELWSNGQPGSLRAITVQHTTAAYQGFPIYGHVYKMLGEPADSLGLHNLENVTFDNLVVAGRKVGSWAGLDSAGVVRNQYLSNFQFPNDPDAEISIDATDAYATEAGDEATFTVRRRGDLSQALTVPLTVRGSAAPGADYAALPAAVVLPAGVASVAVPVKPVADLQREGIETIFVTVENAPFSRDYLVGANYHAVASLRDAGPSLRQPENPANAVAGLDYDYYEGLNWNTLPNFAALSAVQSGTVASFSLAPRRRDDNFAFRYTGFVRVPADGQYTFYTTSDDGSQLFIGSQLVVNNNGLHAAREAAGTVGLKAGVHALAVTFFERTGQQVLNVSYAGPGLSKRAVPAAELLRVSQASQRTANVRADAGRQPSLFPNPTLGVATLVFEVKTPQAVHVAVLNTLGQEVAVKEIQALAGLNQAALPTAALPTGVYQVRLLLDGTAYSTQLHVVK